MKTGIPNILMQVVVALAFLHLLTGNNSDWHRLAMAGMLLFGALHLLFGQHLPARFVRNFIILTLGPTVLLIIWARTVNPSVLAGTNLNWAWFLLVVLVSVFYTMRKRGSSSKTSQRARSESHEREFVAPFTNSANAMEEDNEA